MADVAKEKGEVCSCKEGTDAQLGEISILSEWAEGGRTRRAGRENGNKSCTAYVRTRSYRNMAWGKKGGLLSGHCEISKGAGRKKDSKKRVVLSAVS